jgi:hypothetical protein
MATYETSAAAETPPAPATDRTRRFPPFVVDGAGLGASGWAALLLAAFASLLLAIQGPALMRSLYGNPDVTGVPQLARLLEGTPTDRVVTLSNAPEYEWLAILQATASWPGHWALWATVPFLLALAGLLVVARTMWKTWGLWAMAMAVAALAVTSDGLRITLFALDAHAVSILSMVVLGAVVVAFARRPPRSALGWAAPGIALVALIGPGTADPQLVLTGLVPFAVATIATWRLSGDPAHRRLAAFAVIVTAGALAVGLVLAAAMKADDVSTWSGFELQFATLDRLPLNASLILGGLFELAGTAPSVFGQAIDKDSTLDALIGVPMVLGFIAVVWWGVRSLRQAVDEQPRAQVQRPDRLAFVVFWLAVVVLSLLACAFTNAPKPMATGRYLIPAFYGVAMLAPALAPSRRARTWVAVGVLVFAAGVAGRHVLNGVPETAYGPSADTTHAIEDYVAAHGATVGYATWGDAGPLVWRSQGRLKVYPVTNEACSNELCEGPLMKVDAWYLPRDGVRSYLVQGRRPRDAKPLAVPGTAGSPIAQDQVGEATVSIYDHDLARDLGEPIPTAPVGS